MNSPVVLGLDFGGTKIAAGVCEMSGVRLGTTTVDTRPTDGAEACLDRGIRAARDLLDTLAPGRPLAAVVPCTFGIPRQDRVDPAPTVPEWGDLALRRELDRALGRPQVRTA